jgi:murein DD-endopeptidase MepM/ murein hydrolase activator NlpD
MPPPIVQTNPRIRAAVALLVGSVVLVLAGAPATAMPASTWASPVEATGGAELAERGWVWPVRPFRLARAYVAPAHEYGPGHRGIDLELLGGPEVRAPAAGVVAFAGSVAGRGILTIDHGDGLVTTLEPVQTSLVPSAPVAADEIVGTVSTGGHADAGTLHFGVRLHGDYINPMLLLGTVPRAILLPCCG